MGLGPDASLELREGLLHPASGGGPAAIMVRIELVGRGDGRNKVLEVPGDESDTVLAAALAEGWSVRSVTRR